MQHWKDNRHCFCQKWDTAWLGEVWPLGWSDFWHVRSHIFPRAQSLNPEGKGRGQTADTTTAALLFFSFLFLWVKPEEWAIIMKNKKKSFLILFCTHTICFFIVVTTAFYNQIHSCKKNQVLKNGRRYYKGFRIRNLIEIVFIKSQGHNQHKHWKK